VYNRNIKVFRSTDNQIEFQIKNGDQKPVNIVNTAIVFNLFNYETNTLLLSKDCDILSNISGNIRVIINEVELFDLNPGLYSYSLIQETRDYDDNDNYIVVRKRPLYIDDQYGAVATLEIAGDVLGGIKPTVEVREFSYTNPSSLGEDDPLFFTSSIIDARPKISGPQSLHTFQFYFSDFDGTITIQGSISSSANPQDWVDIPTNAISPGTNNFNPAPESSVIYKNVIGKWNWFRVKQTGHKGQLSSFVINRNPIETNLYLVSIRERGNGYAVGDVLVFDGKRLGGGSVVNDLLVTVTEISEAGQIVDFSFQGTPVELPNFKTYVLEPIVPAKGSLDKILYR
jgi:hypothetical protein